MKCIKPIHINGNTFNCGHCINCRVNYTQMWSLRLIYELSEANAASFLTLTYSPEYYPKDCGLHKEDLQNFFKRLRINLQREYHEFAPKISYYAVGEYGSSTMRCHYHAIVFGLNDLDEKHREIVRKSWPYCEPWLFDKSRGRKSGMQEVTPDDINYVTGYVQKKLDGELAKKTYGSRQPPFSLCSQGLGLKFAEDNKNRLLENGWTYFKGHRVSIPRYYCEKFGVKRADLIKDTVLDKDAMEYSTAELFRLFREKMQKNYTWNPENLKMLEHRMALWLSRREYENAKQIYDDFLHRRKLLGGKI